MASTNVDEVCYIWTYVHFCSAILVQVTAEIDGVQQSFDAIMTEYHISLGNNRQQAGGVGAIRINEEAAVTAACTL